MDDSENTPTIRIRKRSGSGGKRYCVLCSKYEKQILEDGSIITLHRFPGRKSKEEKARRQLWLRGMKLHRPDLPITENSRVCILHFENHTYIPRVSVPRYFNLEKHVIVKKEEPNRGVRRPLTTSFSQELINIDQDSLTHRESIDEIYFAQKVVAPVPHMFFDNIENCQTVLEVESQKQDFPVFEHSVATEHGYSLPPKENTQKHSSSQTEQVRPMGCLRPEDIENNDEKTRYYTGFPNHLTFMLFFETFLKHGACTLNYWEGQKRSLNDKTGNRSKPGRKRKLRPIDEFFMVCLRLRLGLLQEHLSDMFSVSVMTVSRIMNTWINFMFDHMKSLIPWPTKEQILANLPKSFQDLRDVRIVIDATEFFCEKPSSLIAQNLTWSEYKHHNTFKVLVGVAPNGLVTFVSSVWGGHTSDRHITQQDGHMFIPKLDPGDIILADKGFTVADLLPPNIGLNMPPFISRDKQMTKKKQFFKTQQIASSRIVVEMKMEQIKNFRLLQTVLPLSEAHLAEQMIVICAAMTNLYEPLLK